MFISVLEKNRISSVMLEHTSKNMVQPRKRLKQEESN